MQFKTISEKCECTKKCNSAKHFQLVRSAATKLSSSQLKFYCLTLCGNFRRLHHSTGGSLAHVAAACGQSEFLDWLIAEFKIAFKSKDAESGYSPLHCALLHGELTSAQVLLNHEASLVSVDNEGFTPLEFLQQEKFQWLNIHKSTEQYLTSNESMFSQSDPVELYTCGENISYNLGHALHSSREMPEPVDYFRRHSIVIREICMEKFHTLFLSADGKVFSCGHGLGGRLGLGDERVQIEPRLICGPWGEGLRVVAMSAGLNHSLFVTENGQAYACGSNECCQLGIQTPISVETAGSAPCFLSPTQVHVSKVMRDKLSFKQCCASDSFSIFTSMEAELWVCGRNSGGLGLADLLDGRQNIQMMKCIPLSQNKDFKLVGFHCCSIATVVWNNRNDVFLLHDYQVKRLGRQLDLKSVSVVCGYENMSPDHHTLTVLINTISGRLFIWTKAVPHLRRCVFHGIGRMIYPCSIVPFCSGFLAIDRLGCGFRAKLLPPSKQHRMRNDSDSKLPASKLCRTRKSSFNTNNIDNNDIPKGINANINVCSKKSNNNNFAFAKTLGTFLNWSECEVLSLTRIPTLYRCVSAACSPDGKNMAFLQQNPIAGLTDLPFLSESTFLADLVKLWDQVQEVAGSTLGEGNRFNDESYFNSSTVIRENDLFCDLMLKLYKGDIANTDANLSSSYFPTSFLVHKFVLMSRSSYFAQELGGNNVNEFTIVDSEIPPRIYELMLQYLYTGDFPLLTPGTKINLSFGDDTFHFASHRDRNGKFSMNLANSSDPIINKSGKSVSKKKLNMTNQETECVDSKVELIVSGNLVNQCLAIAKRWGLKSLVKRLTLLRWDPSKQCSTWVNSKIQRAQRDPIKFYSNSFPELHDVHIECESGSIVSAHRCILWARSDYFRTMFSHSWQESSTQSVRLVMPTVPASILRDLFNYLYTDDLPSLAVNESVERIFLLMRATDQFLVPGLLEKCEVALASLLTLNNAAEILELSDSFNADALKRSAMQYICLNLAALLESNSLKELSKDCLDDLTKYYKQMFPQVAKRSIRPWSEEPSLEDVETHMCLLQSATPDSCSLEELIDRLLIEFRESDLEPVMTAKTSAPQNQSLLMLDSSVSVRNRGAVKGGERRSISDSPSNSVDKLRITSTVDLAIPTNCDVFRDELDQVVPNLDTLICRTLPAESSQSGGIDLSQKNTDNSGVILNVFERKRLMEEELPDSSSNNRKPTKAGSGILRRSKPWNLVPSSPDASDEIVSLLDVMREESTLVEAEQQRKMTKQENEDTIIVTQRLNKRSGSKFTWGMPPGVVSLDNPTVSPSENWSSGDFRSLCSKPSQVQIAPLPEILKKSMYSTGNRTNAAHVIPKSDRLDEPKSFSQILREEEETMTVYEEQKNKSIIAIQVEERAIEELRSFYDAENNVDEVIVVERARALVHVPIWQAHV